MQSGTGSTLSSQTQHWLSGDRLNAAPELEQAVLRVAVVGVVLAYLLWYVLRDGTIEPAEYQDLGIISGYLAFGVLLTLWILAAPHVSVARRFLGMIGDNAVATYFLSQMGEGGAAIFFVYFLLIFGNGFRYGRLYLHACQLMGIVGFSAVLIVSPFWSMHMGIGVGFLMALILVPLYVGVLVERINAARVRAEEALRECVEREQRQILKAPPAE
jgi:two-component system sensor histidine kinase RpfC